MEKAWKPKVAGILNIIVGSQCLVAGSGIFLFGLACSSFIWNFEGDSQASSTLVFYSAIALPLFIVGALAIRGGLYALKSKRWGLALAGSIAAFLSLFSLRLAIIIISTARWDQPEDIFFLFGLLMGIAAIIFTVLSKSEFESSIDSTEASKMGKAWKPIAAGILDIAGGILGGLGSVVAMFFLLMEIGVTMGWGGWGEPLYIVSVSALLIGLIAIACLPFIGGVAAIQRRRWRLALAGAISVLLSLATACAVFIIMNTSPWEIFVFLLLLIGIASIVLTVQSKNEFE
jgi:hypothetical protein